MSSIGSQKQKRTADAAQKREFCERQKENEVFLKKERERCAKNQNLKKIEMEMLKAELENEKKEKEKWKAKYQRTKEKLLVAEPNPSFRGISSENKR